MEAQHGATTIVSFSLSANRFHSRATPEQIARLPVFMRDEKRTLPARFSVHRYICAR
jgi:hypothetical protein